MQHKTALSKTVRILAALMVALATVLPTVVTAAPTTAPAAAPLAQPETGTISGTVFRDYNANGTQQTWANSGNTFNEPGIAGITVTAYDSGGTVAGSTTSGADGAYSFTATGASGFRVEFTLPTDGSMDYLQPGAAGSTTVVFVPTGGQTGLNVGFNNPTDYSQADPPLITARTAFGPRLSGGGELGLANWASGSSQQANESVVGLAYNDDGDRMYSNQHSVYATLRQTGTLYGMIYQRKSALILAGTYFKAFADTGPKITAGTGQWAWLNSVDPLGAIYGIGTTPLTSDPADIPGIANPGATNAAVYANLNKIMDPTVAQPPSCSAGGGWVGCITLASNTAGVDPRRTGTINYDTAPYGDCDGPGTNGAPANASNTKTCWRHDPVAFGNVGSIGLGDLEEDDAEQFVFVVNLKDKKLYQLPIESDKTKWPIKTLAAPPVAIPSTCSNPADAVPGGLGFKDGKLYVGVTCTAQSTWTGTPPQPDRSQLKAEVWQFDPVAQTFSGAPVFSLPLGYPRGCIYADNPSVNAPKNGPSYPLQNCQTWPSDAAEAVSNADWNPWPQTWQQLFDNNRGANWPGKPGWTRDWQNSPQLEYPHPWLSDISFVDDDLVLGFRDINGDRTGNQVRTPNITATAGWPAAVDYYDLFNNRAYNNTNGTINWSGAPWSESGDDTSPTSGEIQVLADSGASMANYQLQVFGGSRSIQRPATGLGVSTATLSFEYRRVGMLAGETVTVDTWDGSTWTTRATFTGAAGGATDLQYRTHIVEIPVNSSTILRISANAANGRGVWFDRIRLSTPVAAWARTYDFTFNGAGLGDLLRAWWNGNGSGLNGSNWTLESNGTIGTGPGAVTTSGTNNGQGPGSGVYPPPPGAGFTGYGEFYWDDSGPGSRNAFGGTANNGNRVDCITQNGVYCGHEQTMMGGTFQAAGRPDIAVTIADQFTGGDGGLARFSNIGVHPLITFAGNGNYNAAYWGLLDYPVNLQNSTLEAIDNAAGMALRHTRLYDNTAPQFFGKANGLGDVEALLLPAPIEIGNRVWNDVNANGRQDPGEATLQNVTVELWVDNNGDGLAETQVGTATTDANGLYYFGGLTNANMTGGNTIQFNKVYEIRINRGQGALGANNVPTVANADPPPTAPFPDLRDSDGVTIPDTGGSSRNIAGVRFTTGGPGANNHTYDFGFFSSASLVNLGNQVWFDFNNDGQLNNSEVGINGVTVDLYADTNGDGRFTPGVDTFIATQNTATVGPDAGIYNFTNLLPGNYIVHLPQSNFGAGQPLNGMASSTGNNPTPDPDTDVNNDDNGYHIPGNGVASLAVTLTASAEPGPPDSNTNPTVDFGFFGLGAIGNYVWVDENSDGYQDEGEPGIPNVQVNLYNAAGALVATTYTDSHGGYLFDNLPPGSYFVDVLDGTGGTSNTLPTGMTQTPPSTLPGADFGNQAHNTAIPSTGFTGYPVTIGGNQPLENLTADFGYNYNPAGDVNNPPGNGGGNPSNAAVAALGDRVWIDSDGDGAQDPNEVGVSGVTVQIFTAGLDGIFGTPDDVAGATQTTNANGYYMFDGLAPGAYVVKVVSDAGASHAVLTSGQYNQTGDPDHFGLPNPNPSNPANADNATTTPVLLGPGDVFLNADFGYQPSGAQLGSIGDTIWFDADADGTGPSMAPIDGGAAVTQGNSANPADPAEYGIAGVTVSLIRDSNGDGRWNAGEPIIAATTTNANGQYLFPGLPLTDGVGTDDYIVWVNDSNNVLGEMIPTYDKDGRLLPASPSIRTGLGISAVTNLGTTGGSPYGANNVRDQDFGYTNTYQQLNPQNPAQPLGLIGDYVWFDVDRDNVQDADERGVEGVVVELLDATGTTVIATTVTDENGHYSFGGLPLNQSYIVRIPSSNFDPGKPLEGMTNTGGPAGGSGNVGPVVNLTPANPINLVQDFGYAAPTSAQGSIGNQVWEDLNADGIRQPGEPAIAGVTVDLYRDLNGNGMVDPGEPLMGTRTTDASGQYLFSALPIVGGGDGDPEAEYVVDVTDVNGKLAGYWHSLAANQDPNTGVSGSTANDPLDRSKVDPFAIEIGSGSGGQPVSNNLNVDFGYYVKPASVGNFVWLDDQPGTNSTDGNGIQDPGEPGIDGLLVTLTIFYPDGTTHTVATLTGDDPNTPAVEHGWYSFGNLLLDEDYATSTTGTPTTNQPVYRISVPTGGGYNPTLINQGSNDMIDSDDHAGVDALATQGSTNVDQNTGAPGSETNPIAGYDFGYLSTPLAILLASFDATSQADHVLVSWETVSEANNSGFNLYRSLSADGPYTLLGFVPSASPGGTAGAAYSYQDFDVTAGQTYWLKLEDVDLSGATTLHGPVSVLYQAPTAVTLSSVQADGGQTGSTTLALLAGLLAAAGAILVYRRRNVTA
jgi:protocatechuate 3,4-dioxygenase beta subunit